MPLNFNLAKVFAKVHCVCTFNYCLFIHKMSLEHRHYNTKTRERWTSLEIDI